MRVLFRRVLAMAVLVLVTSLVGVAQSSSTATPLLLRNPSLSQDKIAFLYADDVWTVSRQGGEAQRLTSNGKVMAGPFFSPDGSQIAYSAHLDGNTDVYIIPSSGGVPRRITWHPPGHRGRGLDARWQKRADRQSGALSYRHFSSFSPCRCDGSGMPEPLPLPMRERGFVFARRQSHRLSADHQVAAGLEALCGRPDLRRSGLSTSRRSTW